MAVKLRATRPQGAASLNDSPRPPGHNAPVPLERAPPAFKRLLGSDKVRILNESHEIPKGIRNRSDPNALSHVSHRRFETRTGLNKVFNSFVGVRHPPVCHRTARPGLDALDIGVQSEFKATNVEADVKWLIKIRLDTQGGAVPLLCAGGVGGGIEHGGWGEKHRLPQAEW